ncbi:MAG: Gfo/Idh/MocA family oxidoreductase, partial [Candidatus Atribacteria bacterium]|nr:Gfo/Idh/MocA family oxidoreductase [Candidatus Atribacteria bacterium]
MKVKWGVMGAGGIARRRTIPEVVKYAVQSEIVALMDAAPDVSQEVGKEFGIGQCYSSVEELLRADIEAVYVASPVFAHAEQVKLA